MILGYDKAESTKKMEEILNSQVPAEGLELVILLHTQYSHLSNNRGGWNKPVGVQKL